jgi:NADH-quinone oxidoreductase subunit L
LNLPFIHTFTKWLEHTIPLVEEAVGEAAAAGGEAAAEAAASPWYMIGGLNLIVALVSTGLALLAIAAAWYMYTRRYEALKALPAAKRPDDPLRSVLGPVFTGMEHKWWVDELYGLIIVTPYVTIARFLAEVVDWQFWHDFFHDTIIVGGYRGLAWLLSKPFDLGVIDGFANGLADGMQELAAQMRRLQTGFVRNYALSVFVGVVLILSYLVYQLR